MAKLSNIPIADKNSNLDSGAAFALQKQCRNSRTIQLNSGWEVEVSHRSPYVVVRAMGLTEQNVTWASHEAAQEGLDLLSASGTSSGDDDLTIQNSDKDRIVWWRDKNLKQFLRIVSIQNFPFSFSTVYGELQDQFGNAIPRPKAKYHLGLRYARLARTTSDLFDSYRNMYLALEFLTSSISPKARESERAWLKRVLTNSISIYPDFNPVDSNSIDNIYDIRCSLFHAKNEEMKLIPQRREDYLKVKENFERLEWLVLGLSAVMLNCNRAKSFISLEYFELQSEKILKNIEVLLSDQDKQFFDSHLNSEGFAPELNSLLSKHMKKASGLCENGLLSFLASFSSVELKGLSSITGFLSKTETPDGKSILTGAYELDTILYPTNLDIFEIQIGMTLNQ